MDRRQDDIQKYDFSHYSLSVIGNTVKVMEMEKPIYIGPKGRSDKPRTKRVKLSDEKPKEKSTYKARKRLRDLINHNAYRYFDENGSGIHGKSPNFEDQKDLEHKNCCNSQYHDFTAI